MAHKIGRAAVEDAAVEADMEVREDYSGRFMFGEECLGVVGSDQGLARFILAVSRRDETAAGKLATAVRSDSMGRDTIYYFPGYVLREGYELEDALADDPGFGPAGGDEPPDPERDSVPCPDCGTPVAPGEPTAPYCSADHAEAGAGR